MENLDMISCLESKNPSSQDLIKQFEDQIRRADEFGFSWKEASQLLNKIRSECSEVEEELGQPINSNALQQEVGDLLHATLSLILFLNMDINDTLKKSLVKFEGRFEKMQKIANQEGFHTLKNSSLETILDFWKKAKNCE